MTPSALEPLCGPVSRETFSALETLVQEVERWNRSINLIGPATVHDIWRRHIVDSAQVLTWAQEETEWLDIGSGAGFPGLVIAILLKDRPGIHVALYEPNKKKAGFLTSMVGRLSLPVTVAAERFDAGTALVRQPEVISSRALAPLRDLLTMCEGVMQGATKALFHKGRDYRAEIAEAADIWHFDLLEHASVVDPASVILEISGLRRLA
jgi:16S rRNA (guanine527-N7)-methyltransferase